MVDAIKQEKSADTDRMVGIMVASLLPLAGVIFFNWDLKSVMLIYWLESLISGAFVALKLYIRPPWHPGLLFARIFVLSFYLLFWLGFVVAHLLVILVLFHPGGPEAFEFPDRFEAFITMVFAEWMLLPAAILLLTYGWQFIRDWLLAAGWQRVSELRLLGGLLGRVIVIHIILVVGGYVVLTFGQPLILLFMLIAAKLGMDLLAEFISRRFANVSIHDSLEHAANRAISSLAGR